MRRSKIVDQILEGLEDEDLFDLLDKDVADSTCTTGYDNDGSTGYEIFKNGYSLGRRAEGRDVFVHFGDDAAFFFVGDEDEVIANIREALREEN